MPGSRLTEQDRTEIAEGLRAGIGYAAIARQLDRPTSTISREVSRNGGPGRYRPDRAHLASRQRSRRQASSGATSRALKVDGIEAPGVPRPLIDQLTARFVDTGMPRTAAGILACLYTADNASAVAAELAAMLRVSPAAISAAIAYLQAQELISRERDMPRRRDRYRLHEDAWLRAALAGVRQNTAIAGTARTGAAELGVDTAAGRRLVDMAEFLDHVSRDTVASAQRWTVLLTRRDGASPPEPS
ncbi:helix-turn-helix domain-containing protein [Nocardia callitridis]|uniref:Helix-turn-helix domain-containing protein n=1 Tax=Nocardia callitridis TaxID=648753 RepID=A0ABP9KDE1_9NOCA